MTGIDLHVAGVNEGLVVIAETGGGTAVREHGEEIDAFDSYTVRLSRMPTGTVYVTVSASRPNAAEAGATDPADTVWLCSGSAAPATTRTTSSAVTSSTTATRRTSRARGRPRLRRLELERAADRPRVRGRRRGAGG